MKSTAKRYKVYYDCLNLPVEEFKKQMKKTLLKEYTEIQVEKVLKYFDELIGEEY